MAGSERSFCQSPSVPESRRRKGPKAFSVIAQISELLEELLSSGSLNTWAFRVPGNSVLAGGLVACSKLYRNFSDEYKSVSL